MLTNLIIQLVEDNLPAGFTVSQDYLERRLKEWQLYLHTAANIPTEYKEDTDLWSEEWQTVLAYCIIYDIIMRILSGSILFRDITTDEDGVIAAEGEVKKITTGPTDVEFFNSKESWAELIKYWLGPDGLASLLFAKACMAASIVGVKLPFCPGNKLNVGPRIIKFKKPCVRLCRGK